MSLLLWCSFLLFQEGTDNQRILAESVFEVKRFGLVLEDPEAIALLGYAEEPLVFHLAYDGALTPDMRLQAAVVGPGISTPITINQPAEPLQIAIDRHVFTQVGTFRLVNVRLTANNQTLELATPSDAQITVVDDLFVSQVEVREISQQELIEKGYLFKKTDFHAVNFNLSLVLGSKKETVSIDALFPRTEEGAFKPVIIQDPFKPFVKPVFFNFGYKTDDPWSPREKPGANYRPDGILLIPGNINFLKSHFSVTALLLNTAPDALNVRMERLRARLVLPEAGPAGLPVTTNQELRQDMHHPGADGQLGTADDRSAIYSGEKASSEFIVIGNLEGAYPIEVEITGDMVLPQGIEKIQSNSQGMVYVKGQDYSVVFEHPDAVEENEPYDLVMYLRNTGPSLLEGAVQLDPFKLVGTRLAAGQDPQLAFSVGPEGEQALVWHMVATTSGKVLTTYFKGDGVAGIQLRVAVGASGESISPVVFSYPPQFYLLPASLTPDLKFWVKKSIDFSQTPPAKLPSELLPISASVPRELNRQMARIGQSVSWGLPQDVALFQLFELWLGGKDAYLPLDQLRRFYEQSNGLGGAWSSEMSSVFANQNPDQWLTRLAQNFSGCPQSVGFAVQADQSISLTIRDAEGRTHDSNGSRQIPFSSLLDLGNNRYFFWSAHMDATPIIQIESQSPATLQIASVFPDTNLNCVLAKTNLAAVQSVSLGLNPDSRTLTVQMPRQPAQSVQASAIAPLPFALSSVRQVDPKLDKNADAFGRTLLFQFSAPLDLSSLDPIEDHIRINGKPATDAVLQADGRNLFVSSRTPLGPYRPIHFELIGARDLHGQSLGTLNGNFDGSSWFIGVTIQGRVVDQQKDVSGGQVFLMVRKSDGPTSEFPIYQTETLSSDGTFSMDFAPLLTNSEEGDALFSTALKIGVLLPDGRYKEQIFSPQGAGQNLLAEFSFNFEGEVTGTVFAEGQPVPFAEVFLKHNNNPLANEIVQANAEGVFRFRNVEVGPISLKASANGVFAYGNGYLTSGNSPLQIDLFTSTETGGISGHIMIETESETLPVVGAIVGFARFGDQVQYMQPFGILVPFQVYGFVGDDGGFSLEGVPAGSGQLFVVHPITGAKFWDIAVVANDTITFDYTFPYAVPPVMNGVVRGRVTRSGTPQKGVVVSGPMGIGTTTDSNGRYELAGLPVDRPIGLGFYQKTTSLGGLSFTIPSASPLLTGMDLILAESVHIYGTLLDHEGNGVPFTPIYKSDPWNEVRLRPVTETNSRGEFEIEEFELNKNHTYSAAVAPNIASAQVSVNSDDIFGFILQERGTADLRVRLVDFQGNPQIGYVVLESDVPVFAPDSYGQAGHSISHQGLTQADGWISLKNINAGTIQVHGIHPQFGETQVLERILVPQPEGAPAEEITLAFAGTETANLFGTVYDPSGNPVGQGVWVQAQVNGISAKALTSPTGQYAFESLVSGNLNQTVHLNVFDPISGAFQWASVSLNEGLNFREDVYLQGVGDVQVRIEDHEGAAVDYAAITIEYSAMDSVPPEPPATQGEIMRVRRTVIQQITPSQQSVLFENLPAGLLTIRANAGNGLVGLREVALPHGADPLDVLVRLEAGSSISGIFVDGSQMPIPNAEIQLKQNGSVLSQILSSALGGAEGTFLFENWPMRTYQLKGTDPSSARIAQAEVTTSPFQPNPHVVLSLDPLGHVRGIVYNEDLPLEGARVTIRGRQIEWVTGTDPSGAYSFRNLPLGTYTVHASKNGLLPEAESQITVQEPDADHILDLYMEPTKSLRVTILDAYGQPAPGAEVNVYKGSNQILVYGDTRYADADGRVVFPNLVADTYQVRARDYSEDLEVLKNVTIGPFDPDPLDTSLQFPGFGEVFGTVRFESGEIPDHNLTVQIEVGYRNTISISTNNLGQFHAIRIPIQRSVPVRVYDPDSRGTAQETIFLDNPGQSLEINLTLLNTTYVTGHIELADGSPASYAEVRLTQPFALVTQANYLGEYLLEPVPTGPFTIQVRDPETSRSIAQAGEILNDANGFPIPGELDFTFGGVADITGFATLSDGEPVRFGDVFLEPQVGGSTLRVPLQGDGRYLFQYVPLGPYRIRAYDRYLDVYRTWETVFISDDGVTVNKDLPFANSYNLSGIVTLADGVSPAFNGTVELWKVSTQGRLILVYHSAIDDLGHYLINHIYPGDYTLKAYDEFQNATVSLAFTMLTSDATQDLQLVESAALVGSISDGTAPFTSGTIAVTQNGATIQHTLNSSGQFVFEGLVPGPCSIHAVVAQGWYEVDQSITLVGGSNSIQLMSEPTLNVLGQAYMVRVPVAKPQVRFFHNQKWRTVSTNASGDFVLDRAPHNTDLLLEVAYGSKIRQWTVSTADQDLTVGPFVLDLTPPEILFDQDDMTVTTWPFPLNISISEPDAGSANDPSTTQIWVNQIDMTAFFNVDANGLTADWQAFPPGFVFGPNAITVSSRNDSGAQATAQFNLNVAVSEIGLWLSLNENGSPVGGTFSLDGSAVNSIGEQGLLIPGLVPGTHALKAWSGVLGHRDALVLGALPSHGVAVPVGPTGSYSGMVLDPDGLPVSAAILQIGPFLETSQPDGSYLFDLLALQNHAIAAQKDDLLGYVEAPALSSNGEIQNLDLQLEASGRVSGLVLDDDGLTPIESAEVSLTIPGKSSFFDRTALSASDGSFQLDQVLKSDGQLQAYDPLTDRYGYATTTWLDETELMVNIQLAPAGDVLAVVLDADNQPLTNSAFEISGTRTVNGTTDANGQLSALNLPFGSYHLRIERQDLFQYFELDFNLNQDALDLGSLTLLRDVAPQITVFALPASHDPLAPLPIDLDATDDRGLVSWQLDLNGLVLGGDLNGTSVQETLMVALPDLPVGTYPYTFEVADVWGQTAVESGNLNLIHDATGPVLSQIEPAADSHYFELSQVITRVTAVDDQGVDRVEFALLGTATQGSDSRSPYTYGFYLPQVSVATNYTLQITAYDRRGNSSQVDVNLIVDPVTTTGEPDVTLYAPLDGQPLPLFLPQGLDLQIHFAMSDPDKIGGYRLTFNDLVLLEHIYGNTTTYPVDTHLVLPTELRSAEMLVGQLEVWDRGGQTRVIPITIPNINGQVETQLVLGPNQAQGNESYILVGGNHIIDGRNTVQNLVLVNGATLTQTATDEFETHVAGTQLKVLGVLVVDEGCLIDGNGKGFNQLPSAMGISEPHSSHAGLGYGSTDPNEIYGSPFQPSLPGSFTGGGAWQLTSDQIWLLGEIRANGLYQSGSPAFNGSGGSIWLQAEAFHGLGAVRALGYSYGSGRAGGGGRIALYGDFAGKVEAFSFGPTGTGTIYRSVPDPDQPGQRINTLQIRHRDDASSSIPTYLFGPWTLQEDSDFTVREEVMGSDTFQVLTLLAPFGPYQGLPGYLVAFQTAETSIAQQVGLELWSPANQPFGTFVGGETIEIRPPLDAIQVENYGYLNLLDYSPQVDIYLGHLGVLQSESTYVSSGHLLDLSGTCRLIGNFQWDNLTHSSDLKLALTGSATVQNWNQTDGEVYADGSIQADVLTVASAAKIRTQHINGAELTLHSRLMDIQGTVSAPRSGLAVASGPTFRSHGGLGDGTETYGSLYRAESRGNGASYGGGLLTLLADESLVVDGVISSKTEESNGSGGSIHIRTPFFNGTGTLNADGFFSSSKPCGGGRIAIFSNTYAFSGSVHAYGLGYVSGTSYQSGAGTIFIQSDQWPNGRLIVDNGGYQPGMNRSTPLPGLGSRLADAATGLAQILGSNFPDSLAGLYVVSGNNPPARIASNTADTLSPETSFPAIGAGEEYHGLHRLDVLEVRGKAHLYSIDPIEVLDQLIINDGTLEVPQLQMDQPLVLKDGKGRLISPVSDLTLDNFDLVIDQPVNMDTLTLVNGSSLTYRQPIVITTIMVSDSDLIAAVPGHDPGLIAQDLTLINSGWTVANRPTASSFYELVAQIDGTLLIDTNSEIASSGSNKTPSSAFEWPTGVAYATETHGGFNRLGNHANYPTGYAEEPVFGNYVRPLRPGPQNGGGVIHLVANQIENQGMIQSDAPAFNYRSGGSVLLEVNTLVGNGTIAAREGSSGGGGGRIAIHYQGSDAFKTSMSLTTQKVGDQGITTRGGAGTIFLKGPGQTYGELVIDQTGSRIGTEDGLESRQRLTGIPGHSRITLSIEDNGPANQISDPAWELAPDLAFQWIRLTYDGQTYQRQIVDNSYTGLMLSEDLPKPIPAGTELELILKLDALTLKGGALLFYPGLIETAALNLGPEMNTGNGVWCRDLIGLPNPLVINSERLLLSLEEPQWQTQDITVQNGILVLAKPLEVHDLNLVDGFVTQSLVNMAYAANHLFEPALELTAHQITFSGSSRIDANGKVYKNTLFGNSGTHGGLPSNGSGTTFGSLYQPQEYGNRQSYFSGGRVHVIANTIQNGVFAANGDRSSGNGAGGSIWIEAQTLIGDLQCDASSDSIGRDGGGRIAVYAGTTDGAILTNTSGYGGSSGTAFIHIADQHTFGELRIVNSTVTSVPTPILGFAPTTVPAGFSATFVDGITSITLPGLSETNDLSGYRLIPRNDPASAARVLSNSTSGDLQIVVEGDLSDLQVGDPLALEVWVDNLVLQNAQLSGDVPVVEFPADTTPPTIDEYSLTPFYGDRLDSGLDFQLLLTASDDVAVDRARATIGGVAVDLTGAGPFTFNLAAPVVAALENHDLLMEVWDAANNPSQQTVIIPVEPPDTMAPVLTILAPNDGETLLVDTPFDLRFTISDNRWVDQVSATFDGTVHTQMVQANDGSVEWTLTFQTPNLATAETRTLHVEAVDIFGNIQSEDRTLTISPATIPVVTWLQPTATYLVAGTTVTVSVDAQSANGIDRVSLGFEGQTAVEISSPPYQTDLVVPPTATLMSTNLVAHAWSNTGDETVSSKLLTVFPTQFALPEIVFHNLRADQEIEVGSKIPFLPEWRFLHEDAQGSQGQWMVQQLSGATFTKWAIASNSNFPGAKIWRSAGSSMHNRLVSPVIIPESSTLLHFLHRFSIGSGTATLIARNWDTGVETNLGPYLINGGYTSGQNSWVYGISVIDHVMADLSGFEGQSIQLIWDISIPAGSSGSWEIDEISVIKPGGPAGGSLVLSGLGNNLNLDVNSDWQMLEIPELIPGPQTLFLTATDSRGLEWTSELPFEAIVDQTPPFIALDSPTPFEVLATASPFDLEVLPQVSDGAALSRSLLDPILWTTASSFASVEWVFNLSGAVRWRGPLNQDSFEWTAQLNEFDVPAFQPRLSIFHRVNGSQTTYAVLEARVSGATIWQDLGPAMIEGEYTAIVDQVGHPLNGRSAWVGNYKNFQTTIDLSEFSGQKIELRIWFHTPAETVHDWTVEALNLTGIDPSTRPVAIVDSEFEGQTQSDSISPYQFAFPVPTQPTTRQVSLSITAEDPSGLSTTLDRSLLLLAGQTQSLTALNLQEGDTSLENQHLALLAGSHVINGEHTFASLVLAPGAVLSHTASPSNLNPSGMDLTLSGALIVLPDAIIDLNGRGYPGQSTDPGLGLPSSHGHGGLGPGEALGAYGNPYDPFEPGSATGGGRIRISADHIQVDGTIRANGSSNAGQFGSGGSVSLFANSISGVGRIQANGFEIGSNDLSGGGGRIALNSAGSIDYSGYLEALGGPQSGAGTIYLQSATTKTLRVSNFQGSAGWTPLPGPPLAGTNLQVQNASVQLDNPWTGSTFTIDGGWLKFETSSQVDLRNRLTLMDARLQGKLLLEESQINPPGLSRGSLELVGEIESDIFSTDMDFNSQIGLAGTIHCQRFLPAEYGEIYVPIDLPNWPLILNVDQNLNLRYTNLNAHNGAGYLGNRYSHAGIGVHNNDGTPQLVNEIPYGNLFYPDTPGYGGGVVQIYADSVSFDGEINVSGFDNYDQYGPNNGAAGSIYIETNSISGYGSLYAEGGIHYESDGQSTPTEVAGSGGRIAIRVLQSGGNNFHGDYYASGASVFGGNASPGTIYFEDPDSFPFGKLIIRDDYGTIPEFSGPARVEGLGFRTAIADDIDGDNHLQVGASDYPESMAGRYLIHELDLPVRLSANDAASLTGEAVFPAILSGESYNGRIRLSSLQLGWDFESVDEIETDEFIHDFGSYMIPNFTPPKRKTLQDGSSDALDLTHIEDLELENFQLTLNRDLNLKTLTLRNGSSLVLSPGAHHLIVDQLILENSRLELNGSITAQTLTLGAGSVLQHGALPQWDWPGLTLAATDIQIADSARIDLNGRGLNEWPLLSITHGGLGSNSQLEQLYDSPAYPSLPGRGEHGGGLLAITAQHLQLDGHIQADGLGLSSGGAVLIQVQILSGNGEITVRGGELAGSHPQFGGGGRIALHYENATAFRGRLLTGDALAFLGSLWLENRQSGLIQLAAGLESGQLDTRFLPILPTWQRPGSEIASQMRNAKGSVWLLKTESELETLPPLKGLWIRHHDQIARVNDVLQLAPDRFLLSLDGEIEWFEDSPIEALIQVDNAGQIVSHPHSIPIQLREAR